MRTQRYLALDDRVAWAYFELTEELLSGETIEDWVTLNGKQGDGQEGTINIILSFTVRLMRKRGEREGERERE